MDEEDIGSHLNGSHGREAEKEEEAASTTEHRDRSGWDGASSWGCEGIYTRNSMAV